MHERRQQSRSERHHCMKSRNEVAQATPLHEKPQLCNNKATSNKFPQPVSIRSFAEINQIEN